MLYGALVSVSCLEKRCYDHLSLGKTTPFMPFFEIPNEYPSIKTLTSRAINYLLNLYLIQPVPNTAGYEPLFAAHLLASCQTGTVLSKLRFGVVLSSHALGFVARGVRVPYAVSLFPCSTSWLLS